MSHKFPILTLKPDREKPVKNRHHWIFTGAVAKFPSVEDGDIVEVQSDDGETLGFATVNTHTSICARMLCFDRSDPLAAVRTHMQNAIDLRSHILDTKVTTAYRLINGEGDSIPGLIVDRYGEILVLQLSTAGMDRLRSLIVDTLKEICAPVAIYEKSVGASRRKEGLMDQEGWAHGGTHEPVDILENGLTFTVAPSRSQKTGLFLDQREMRALVQELSRGRTLLNCFSYTGGFSVYALAGGAAHVDSVDSSAEAIADVGRNMEKNGFGSDRHDCFTEDVFLFLEKKSLPHSYDFIILDPPAFAKRGSDLKNAVKGYTSLNRLAFERLPSGGLLLTCSCSYHVDAQTFQSAVFHAAKQAKRNARILHHHRLAMDHPVNLNHPEGEYLKSLLLVVE